MHQNRYNRQCHRQLDNFKTLYSLPVYPGGFFITMKNTFYFLFKLDTLPVWC
jgi:hypothetical protein